jgi:hypothetical protein
VKTCDVRRCERVMDMYRTILTTVALGLALIGVTARLASAQLMPKAQVGDNAKDRASTAQA